MLVPNSILQNRYHIVRELGHGGMGTVYEAIDERLSCVVALKETLVGANHSAREAFQREAALLANLRHASLPKVMDYFSEGDGEFLVMEYIAGHDLAELLEQQQAPFLQDQVLAWADDLLKLLDYLHTRQPPIVHRDIKPANLKITSEGEIFLLDFGLAKGAAGQMATVRTEGSVHGYTPLYAPLEQIHGQGTDPRTDIYSLGATLYDLLTGQPPVAAPVRFEAIENERPDPLLPANRLNSRVPSVVAEVIQNAMALSRRNRLSSAAEMRNALQRAKQTVADVEAAGAAAEKALDKKRADAQIDPDKPLITDSNVEFTVYSPRQIKPEKNYTMLAFAHLAKKRDDAPADEPDPIEEMKDQAARILGKQQADYEDVNVPSGQPVPREGEITFVPTVPGITFSPASRTFTWRKSVHREEFDLWAAPEMDGKNLSGQMTVFLGSLVIAEVRLMIAVNSRAESAAEKISLDAPQSGRRLRQIFASYSHQDEQVVAELAQVAPLFGSRFVMDRTHLEPGEDRREGLQRLIRGADMFQLFWSTNAMRSADTVDEINYAVSLARPGFILPTYWEEPLPRSPADELPPPAIERLQFHRIFPGAISLAPFYGKLSRLVILAPVGSEIFLDDERQGSTGRSGRLIISSLKTGKHILRFTKRGYRDDEQIVDIKDGVDEQVVQAHFQPAPFGPASAESVAPTFGTSRPESAAHGGNFERVDVVPTGELGPIDQAVGDTAPLEAPPELRAAIEAPEGLEEPERTASPPLFGASESLSAPETPRVTAPLEIPRNNSPTPELPPLLETLPAPQPAFATGVSSAPTFGTVICSTCGMSFAAGMKFCTGCGGTLMKAKVPDPIYHATEAVLTSPTQSFQYPSVAPATVQAAPVAVKRRFRMMPIYAGATMVLLAMILVPAWLIMSVNLRSNSSTLPSATPQYTTAGNSNTRANSNTSSSQPGFTVKPGIQFVYIPPGKFTMGSENGEPDEKPVHEVTIHTGFYMGAYEITQAQWQALLGSNPSKFKDCGNCPVESVSWTDAQDFIGKLNAIGDGYNYRLPSEAEWEYACRAGSTGDRAGDLKEMAWFSENSGMQVHPVGRKKPNAWGLYDMYGNAVEWCEDWYHETYDGAPTDGTPWLLGGDQKHCVSRGGAFDDPASVLRSSNRNGYLTPVDRFGGHGFRVMAVRRTQ